MAHEWQIDLPIDVLADQWYVGTVVNESAAPSADVYVDINSIAVTANYGSPTGERLHDVSVFLWHALTLLPGQCSS